METDCNSEVANKATILICELDQLLTLGLLNDGPQPSRTVFAGSGLAQPQPAIDVDRRARRGTKTAAIPVVLGLDFSLAEVTFPRSPDTGRTSH